MHLVSDTRNLLMGLVSVLVGQILVVAFYLVYRSLGLGKPIQKPQPTLQVMEGLRRHVTNAESFFELCTYLTLAYVGGLLPRDVYNNEYPIDSWRDFSINWVPRCRPLMVLLQLLFTDFFMYLIHVIQHSYPPLYRWTHKPHHMFVKPHAFHAFSGSIWDTFFLILIPLHATVCVLPGVSLWDYIGFGVVYSGYLFLIHSDVQLPWDSLLRKLGVAVPEDHQVHHALPKFNFGHLFTFWDRLGGTYRPTLKSFQTTTD